MRTLFLLIVGLLSTTAIAAAAATQERLGMIGAWEAYVYPEGGGKVCYMAARSQRMQGGEKDRRGTAMAVTHRSRSPGEVSLIADYGLKKDSEAEIQIGGMKHTFITAGKASWPKDAKADASIIAALAKGRDVTVRTVPVKGGSITDIISLTGFSDALAAIDKACGVKR